MTKKKIRELKYDFDCKVATVYRFLEMFAIFNGERSFYSAVERYLDERKKCIVSYE